MTATKPLLTSWPGQTRTSGRLAETNRIIEEILEAAGLEPIQRSTVRPEMFKCS